MKFTLAPMYGKPPASATTGAYLEANTWNDYGYRTLWTLYIVAGGTVHEIGGTKIADVHDNSDPRPPDHFAGLSEDYFSLGQDADYYDRLNKLGEETRDAVLVALRDIALDLELFDRVRSMPVTKDALLRWVKPVTVKTQLHRLALGGAKLSPYSFTYTSAPRDRDGDPTIPARLNFEVEPDAMPRTNVHVIIGRNGVGKSFMLNDITTALTRPKDAAGHLEFNQEGDARRPSRFANVVSVAFSAFDSFPPVRRQSTRSDSVKYHYIGLKRANESAQPQPNSSKANSLKSSSMLASDFGGSLRRLVDAQRQSVWLQTLRFLSSDPIFGDCVLRLAALDLGDDSKDEMRDSMREEARRIFGQLSSGHKIVLLTLTRLVETVEEATLVLVDEPESHLHPPLLAAFLAALSELLETKNGVAIIATHSPVVVQEVPRACVNVLSSAGGLLSADQPMMETYGENVGTLTHEVFGLEVTTSGFHRALRDAVADGGDFREILLQFEGQLGAEARALLQTIIHVSRD